MARARGPMRARTWRRFLPRVPRVERKHRRSSATVAAERAAIRDAALGPTAEWSAARVAARAVALAHALHGCPPECGGACNAWRSVS